ncbi:MAG: amidohydrolase family protein, partial [Gillisia sp.]
MKKIVLIFCGIIFASNVNAQDLYIQSGKLVDTKNGKVLTEKTIVVSGNKIKSIENGYVQPKNS